ncbi:hypothetical protein D3C87_1866330 [compost metagenome]
MPEMKSNSNAKVWMQHVFLDSERMLAGVRVVISKGQKQRFKCSSSLHPSLVSIAIAYIKRVFCLSGCIGNVSVGDIFPIRPEMKRGSST